MNITLDLSEEDLASSRKIIEGMTREELTHKFIQFLSAEQNLEDWRKQRYSADTRALVEQARTEAAAEKEPSLHQKEAIRQRFEKTCKTIAQELSHD